MNLGNRYFFDGRRFLCVYQKLNKKVAKAICPHCEQIVFVNAEKLLEEWECSKCGKLLYLKWFNLDK